MSENQPQSTPNLGTTSDWSATQYTYQGRLILNITYTSTLADGDYSSQLAPHTPQGSDPSIFLMDRALTQPPSTYSEPTTLICGYRARAARVYTQLHILPDDVTVTVTQTPPPIDASLPD